MTRYDSAEAANAASQGGAHGYIVSPRGAKMLLDYIQKHGMTNAIDTMMLNCITPATNVLFCSPILINAQWQDTDIQDFTPGFHRDMSVHLNYYAENGISDVKISHHAVNDEGIVCRPMYTEYEVFDRACNETASAMSDRADFINGIFMNHQ